MKTTLRNRHPSLASHNGTRLRFDKYGFNYHSGAGREVLSQVRIIDKVLGDGKQGIIEPV